jgi:hypothetical protein
MGIGRKTGSGSAARAGKRVGCVDDEKASRYAAPFLIWDLDLYGRVWTLGEQMLLLTDIQAKSAPTEKGEAWICS